MQNIKLSFKYLEYLFRFVKTDLFNQKEVKLRNETLKLHSVPRIMELISCQFHQHFTLAFFANILVAKNFKPKTQLCNFWRQNFV